ncbi:hypothetical protein AGMMS50229_02350 [Campylobacterota bacterium]|nr:hypothetical protein AGMMS50229_02350 [Campylobacterota bacterium]
MAKQYGKFYTKFRQVRGRFWHKPRLWLTYKINLFLLQHIFRYSRITLRDYSALGDALRLTHIARELRLRYPKIRITIATKWEALFRNNPNVFATIPRNSRRLFIFPANLVTKTGSNCHLLDNYLDAIGIKPPYNPPKLELFLQEAEIAAVQSKLPASFIVIQPNSNSMYPDDRRNWGFERFDELVRLMSDTQFVQIGLTEERLLEGVVDLRGLPILGSAAVCKLASAGVFNDCGLMHLANAVDTRSVVIWSGATSAEHAGYPTAINLRSAIECSPCGTYKTRCPNDMKCMELITPQMVAEALKSIQRKN